MNLSFWKNRILCVHKFIEKHSQRISIVLCIFGFRLQFEIFMIEVWDICSFSEYFFEILIQRLNLAYFRYSILEVNVFDMK